MEILKLMVESIVESRDEKYYEYQVFPMDDFNEVTEDLDSSEIVSKLDKYFELTDDWFLISDKIKSFNEEEYLEFLENNSDKIFEVYNSLEEENNYSYNCVEIRRELLKKYVYTSDEVDESKVIYQDVSLEAIAEILQGVSIPDIKQNFGYYGSMRIIYLDDMYYYTDENQTN